MSIQRLVADLHLHSRHSMATSPHLNITALSDAAAIKGIDILAAPDFTHPAWREEMRAALVPSAPGVYKARSNPTGPSFILITEIACIWYQTVRRSRRVHVLLMAPSFEVVDSISTVLGQYQRLESDGRPMIKLSAEDLYSIALEVDTRCIMIPAHVWTPWYGVYGSRSGFDSLEECFGKHNSLVPAIETGLSSDPSMNWGISDIGDRSIVSFSDAHSLGSIGRELTILDATPDYESVRSALFENRVVETVEFHPEHGKYNLNGHRKCNVRLKPENTPEDGKCPVCRRPLTLGVLHRVSELSKFAPEQPLFKDGLFYGKTPNVRPYRRLVPLRELVGQGLMIGQSTKKVTATCQLLVNTFESELNVLVSVSHGELSSVAGEHIANLIYAVRKGNVTVEPGYDGVYGSVSAQV